MWYDKKNQSRSIWFLLGFIVWLVINIRVEAGMGSSFERAVDGLAGGTLLLVAIFFTFRFFRCTEEECGKNGKCNKDQ